MDIMFIVISFVLVTSVVFLVVWGIMNTLNPIFDNVSPTQLSMDKVDQIMGYSKIFDWSFALIFFIMVMMSVMFAWYINTSPAFFFLTIILDIVIIFVANIAKTVYLNILELSFVSGMQASFPIVDFLMNNLTIIILVVLVIQGIFMFSATRDGVL